MTKLLDPVHSAATRGAMAEAKKSHRSMLPALCEGCDQNYADPPSKLCPGCQAYRDHQS